MKQAKDKKMQTFDLGLLKKQLNKLDAENARLAFTEDFALCDDVRQMPNPLCPTRLKMCIFGICLETEGEIEVDGQMIKFEKNHYIALLPNQVVKMVKGHFENSKVIFICLSSKLFEELLQSIPEMLQLFFYIRQNQSAELPEEYVTWMRKVHRNILDEMKNTDNLFRRQTARALITAVFYKMCDVYGKLIVRSERVNRKDDLFRKFLQLLNDNYLEHKNVGWYAEQLYITPKYMSMVIKDVSGQTANDWIQSYIVQEAKRMLKNSSMSIQQIALALKFTSQSFFGKFFKNVTGISPNKFRSGK